MSRTLIIKLGAIGDVVMAIPAAHALHARGSRIDWICGTQVLPLLERYGWIRPIPIDDRALLGGSAVARMRALLPVWGTVAGVRYDLCATLYYDARYRLIALPVRARRRLLLSQVDRRRRLLPGRHHTEEYLRVMEGGDEGPVVEALAPVRPDTLPASAHARESERQRVALAPGGARNAVRTDVLRRYPMEGYVEIARALLALGVEVVLVGGPEDRWVSPAFEGLGVTDLTGALALLETVALLETCDVVVTHDTGPLHLAGITRAGIVGLFGPTDPRGRLPQRAGAVAMWGGEGFACRPCYDGREYAQCKNNLCVQQVTPAMVVAEVERMLAQRRAGEAYPPRVVVPRSTVTAGLAPGRAEIR